MTPYLKHWRRYATINNIVVVLALCIALSLVWGTVVTLQRNFAFQRQVDDLDQQVELLQLQSQNLKYQQKYFQSDEFSELSAREQLGKVAPGEKLVILPSSEDIKDTAGDTTTQTTTAVKASNYGQWMQFLFGGKKPSS